jgi:hypothetical protein
MLLELQQSKRYAELSNEVLNEFVSIIGKHVESQLGKTLTTSQELIEETWQEELNDDSCTPF